MSLDNNLGIAIKQIEKDCCIPIQ